jgi:dolichyl-diphosphooligosaccharide---protein glycosyltransferase subunit 3/6
MLYSSLVLAALTLSPSLVHLAAANDATRAKFAKLAQANHGIVRLDSNLYEEIVAPGRDWSVVIEYTALGKEFGCSPCQYVLYALMRPLCN